ncbi:MAG: TldD/PmbA family protein [Gemmatimonadales bacterium]|nr:TldD/PmbA family protein [Gemmatimonadales bacterium]
MIADLLARLAGRTQAADVLATTDESLVVALDGASVVQAIGSMEEGVAVRALVEGRLGYAATTDADLDLLVDRAIASAAGGLELPLLAPGPSALPRLETHAPRAAAAGVRELAELARQLAGRLERDGRGVTVRVEKSAGRTRVGNSRGVDAAYDTSLVAAGVTVTRQRDGVAVHGHLSGIDLPEPDAIEQLVADIEQRFAWATAPVPAPASPAPVLLLPSAARALLAPVLEALIAEPGAGLDALLIEGLDEPVLHGAITLRDDPWLEGRPASRPVDDEGVATWPQVMVERGVVRRLAADLEAATLLHRPASGHARWPIFGTPRAALSNVLLAPGESDLAELLRLMGDGLLLESLAGASGIARSGAFHLPVALGYRVDGGEVTGRVDGAVVSGNAFELFASLGGLGRERRWVGSCFLPAVLADRIEVAAP